MMTDRDVAALLAVVCALWPNHRVDDEVLAVRLWSRILSDVSFDDAETALVELARGGAQFAPGPGELVAKIQSLRALVDGAPDLDQALVEVREQIRREGYTGTPRWSHPAIAETVDAIGWLELCRSTSLDVVRGQFARIYDGARRRHETRRRLAAPTAERLGLPAPQPPTLTIVKELPQ